MRTLQAKIFTFDKLELLEKFMNQWLKDMDAFDIKSVEITPHFSKYRDGQYWQDRNEYIGIITYYLPMKNE